MVKTNEKNMVAVNGKNTEQINGDGEETKVPDGDHVSAKHPDDDQLTLRLVFFHNYEDDVSQAYEYSVACHDTSCTGRHLCCVFLCGLNNVVSFKALVLKCSMVQPC